MPGIWTRTPAPGSTPSASLSPSLFLLPMSSVFQVKVKRANVPDLSATISCSGSLLGINKTNLTQKKTKKQEREREAPKLLYVRGGGVRVLVSLGVLSVSQVK